jgi:hypothetical protein
MVPGLRRRQHRRLMRPQSPAAGGKPIPKYFWQLIHETIYKVFMVCSSILTWSSIDPGHPAWRRAHDCEGRIAVRCAACGGKSLTAAPRGACETLAGAKKLPFDRAKKRIIFRVCFTGETPFDTIAAI